MIMRFEYPLGATPIDPDEALGLIPSHIATQDDLNAWEEMNIVQGATWIENQNIVTKLNEGLVRDLHRRMFDKTWKWAGIFRKSNKNIGVDWPQISVRLRNLLENTLYQIEYKAMSKDEIVIRFHHQLVWIHAFPNGNGRHARLMADALIMDLGEERFSWGSNNSIVTPGINRQNYLSALRAADQGDFQLLTAFARS